MKRLTLFIICALAVASMGQLKISGRKPATISGYVPSKWDGVDTDFSGSESEPDTSWSPASGAITLLDSLDTETYYRYPLVEAVPNTRLVIIGYTDGSNKRILESRLISETDTIGDVIDTWVLGASTHSSLTLLDQQNTEQFLVSLKVGTTTSFFTTTISAAGVFSKVVNDSVNYATDADKYYKSFQTLNLKDSLFVNVGTKNNGGFYYFTFFANWDTIRINQDIFSHTYTNDFSMNIDVAIHKDHYGDPMSIVSVWSGYSYDGFVMKTFITGDTVSNTYSFYEYQTGNGETPSVAHIPNTEYFAIMAKMTSTTHQSLWTFEGDTTSQAFTQSAHDAWIYNTLEGYCEMVYVPRSDSLFLATHYNTNNLYTYTLGVTPGDGNVVESFFGADTLTKNSDLNLPSMTYVIDGLFIIATESGGGFHNGMLILYGMD